MHMIIIIEGIDRVGKTTIAKEISDKFNIPIYKQERIGGNKVVDDNKSDITKQYCNSCKNYLRAKTLVDFWNWQGFNQHIIMDRFHWTEAVYSLIDRHNMTQYHSMRLLEQYMLEQKDNYIVIYVKPVDIKYSSREHGSNLERHEREFDVICRESKLNKMICTIYSKDMVIGRLSKILNKGDA